MKSTLYAAALTLCAIALPLNNVVAQEQATPSPEGAEVYIATPQDGDTVKSPVTVVFGLNGMGVAPAGIQYENSGHHHLLVDQDELPPNDQPLGSPPIHFGKGQTQTTIELEPGTHTLQLILGNYLHIPHTPPVISEKITITVE